MRRCLRSPLRPLPWRAPSRRLAAASRQLLLQASQMSVARLQTRKPPASRKRHQRPLRRARRAQRPPQRARHQPRRRLRR
eukprot:5406373-Alexandrium_andersonii.AAC.1